MEKEIKINCPEGYEIDKENSTFECIKFKPIKNKLPKTWKEFCETHPIREGESYINAESTFNNTFLIEDTCRNYVTDRNLLPNEDYAKAMLALCQLIQLRDCYNDGWVPDWNNYASKYYIASVNNTIYSATVGYSRVLSFKTKELCDEFPNNFKDLIEIAKPLI